MIWSISYRPFDLSIQMRISIYDWNRIFRNKVIDGFHLVYCECITWYKQYFVYFQCIQVTEGVKIESQIFFELVSFISRLAQIKVQPEKMSDLSIFQQESDTSVSPSGKGFTVKQLQKVSSTKDPTVEQQLISQQLIELWFMPFQISMSMHSMQSTCHFYKIGMSSRKYTLSISKTSVEKSSWEFSITSEISAWLVKPSVIWKL